MATNIFHLWSLTVFHKMVTYGSTGSLFRAVSNNALYNKYKNK